MGINRVEGAPFAQISNEALRDRRLSFRARGILAMVLSNVGEWHATREWIARQSDHEGRQAIQTALNELTAYGYRRVHKERGPGGTWVTVTSWYHHANGELVQESTETRRELVQKPDRPETRPSGDPSVGEPVRPIEDHSKNTSREDQQGTTLLIADATSVPDSGLAFAEFWSAYPRKVGKAAAKKAWAQAVKRAPANVITAACFQMANDPNLPADRSLIPHPTTWLNRDGWEDEPYPPPTPAQILADRGSRPTPIPPRFDASKLHPDNPIPMPENVRQLLRGEPA